MRALNARSLLQATFREAADLPSNVDAVEFVQRHHNEVYRVHAGGQRYVCHLALEGTESLRTLRAHLQQLEVLGDARIPRVVAWRAPSGESLDEQWAALVCTEIPGEELSPQAFSLAMWNQLCELLIRVHQLKALDSASGDPTRIDDPDNFPAVAESLVQTLIYSGAPLRLGRVQRHLDAIGEYLSRNRADFRIQSRLIHGDLSRANILVGRGRPGIIDWADLGPGDYAYDLATLKFSMDSVAPRTSARLLRDQVLSYRAHFGDDCLELRMRYFLALPGLVSAMWYAGQDASFAPARAWRVRTCYLHSEAQWRAPLRLDGDPVGAPAALTELSFGRVRGPLRGLFYLLAPKRVT
jgi:Ser/Thr protein kinase RdoA (MazF antagonist)